MSFTIDNLVDIKHSIDRESDRGFNFQNLSENLLISSFLPSPSGDTTMASAPPSCQQHPPSHSPFLLGSKIGVSS